MVQKFIFVINTGSTTTKCSLYQISEGSISEYLKQTIDHPDEVLLSFKSISDQVDYREKLVRRLIDEHLPEQAQIVAVGAIGGMLPPVPSGVIELNSELADYSLYTPVYQHASNLGAALAYRISQSHKAHAYVVDPVGVDELNLVARISGSPDFPRFAFGHPLNIRATIRKLARQIGRDFEQIRCVAVHLGGGFSIVPFMDGRIIDTDNRMESAPFTPERAGGVPPIPLMEACFSGRYTRDELHRKLYGAGGIYGYLGTKDIREVCRRIREGDRFARFIYDAMIYQVCKEIGAMASVLDFEMDCIVISGGVAHEEYLISEITRKCRKLAAIHVYPGENENEAIAESVYAVLDNTADAKRWPDCVIKKEDIDPFNMLSGKRIG